MHTGSQQRVRQGAKASASTYCGQRDLSHTGCSACDKIEGSFCRNACEPQRGCESLTAQQHRPQSRPRGTVVAVQQASVVRDGGPAKHSAAQPLALRHCLTAEHSSLLRTRSCTRWRGCSPGCRSAGAGWRCRGRVKAVAAKHCWPRLPSRVRVGAEQDGLSCS